MNFAKAFFSLSLALVGLTASVATSAQSTVDVLAGKTKSCKQNAMSRRADHVTVLNKKIVTDFYDLAFTQRKPTNAAMKYISPKTYIQHNPQGKDGREAFLNGFAKYVENGTLRCTQKRAIAENDLVVIHSHCIDNPADPKDRGEAFVDIFRVQYGKIVEHWDVGQAVPATSANSNTMF